MRTALRFGALLLVLLAPPAEAQLASPGPLSRAHAQLEGLRSCTRCHELRQEGVAAAKCLACHTPLATRLRARRGYHGRQPERDCAVCHQEHIGAATDIVRLDTAAFRHEQTGWPLRGAHAAAGCRSCHQGARVVDPDVRSYAPSAAYLAVTYLGVVSTCAGCHVDESPHEASINRRPCERCHDETDWTSVARFDHEDSTYPLTGAHRPVPCAECHRRGDQLRLTPIAHASCADCHRDPHAGRFGAGCSGCHQTAAWQRVPTREVAARFDHARTRFPLRGAHATATCAACHERATAKRAGMRITFQPGAAAATFPAPVATACGSCHEDFHQGQVRPAAACGSCHSEQAWLPVQYELPRHQSETRFPLAGAHLAVPCSDCHARPSPTARPQMHWPDLDCRVCHAADDPHGGMFPGQPCGACHQGGTFAGATFDHASVAGRSCDSCHLEDNVHGEQFTGGNCGDCHVTGGFRIERFDHTRTRFPLEGAHARTACVACHPAGGEDGIIRYRPLPVECAGCHGVRP